jgi:hypothetical protein
MTEEGEFRQQAKLLSRRLEPVYQLLNWKWWNGKIPTARDIEQTFVELYHILGQRFTRIERGGLFVCRKHTTVGDELSLGFVIDEVIYLPIDEAECLRRLAVEEGLND